VPYYTKEIEILLKNEKNILISAHGNSLRALCKKIFNISDTMITKLEIPTGNPILIKMNSLKVQNFEYLDQSRAKEIITNQ
jgi:Phosphoglycerate mutase 1